MKRETIQGKEIIYLQVMHIVYRTKPLLISQIRTQNSLLWPLCSGLLPQQLAFMAKTDVKKKLYCQHQHCEFQHITMLKIKEKKQFLFMDLLTPMLYRLLNTLETFWTSLCTECLVLLRGISSGIRYKILRHGA